MSDDRKYTDINCFVHKTSEVGKRVYIGEATKIWQNCTILDDVTIGCQCNIGQNVYIESGVTIGNRVKIKNNIAIYQGVVCEDDVFIGPNCVFTNVINPRSFINRKEEIKKTIIKKGATLGANSTIVCGNTVGKFAMVGAGSVVTRNVKPFELVYGNPAKVKGYVCICGSKLEESAQIGWMCKICKRAYVMENDELVYKGDNDGVY